MSDILLILNIVLSIIVLILVFKSNSKDKSSELSEKIDNYSKQVSSTLKEEISLNRREFSDSNRQTREEIAHSIKDFGDSLNKQIGILSDAQNKNFTLFSRNLENVISKNDEKMERIRGVIEKKLGDIQKDNGEKLEKMRQTVDEKLHSTLEKRLGESFELVSKRLELVQRGLGEMQVLATGVGDLKKVLQNVKTRGTWGEVQLENLLEQFMTLEQFEKNIATKKNSNDRVEFAIKIPAKDEKIGNIFLPIDAKFPLEDYQRLIIAEEEGNIELIEKSKKTLIARIKAEAKTIKEKYVDPPFTTDFGILFLPIEGLYAEILRQPGLMDFLQREYRIIVAGPTTISAILNSLQMGFKTLAIEKRSSDVWALLGSIKKEFSTFGDLLEKTQKKLQETSNVIEKASSKSRTIERKLKKVEQLPRDSQQVKKII